MSLLGLQSWFPDNEEPTDCSPQAASIKHPMQRRRCYSELTQKLDFLCLTLWVSVLSQPSRTSRTTHNCSIYHHHPHYWVVAEGRRLLYLLLLHFLPPLMIGALPFFPFTVPLPRLPSSNWPRHFDISRGWESVLLRWSISISSEHWRFYGR